MSSASITLSEITAVILAGGLGTRLRSVVADRPKVLADVDGRPFLALLLDQLANAGITEAVICTGYMAEQIEALLGPKYKTLHLVYSQESSPLGTGGALRLALPLIKSDWVLVMNGDSICLADLSAFWTWHLEHRGQASVLLAQVTEAGRYGQVSVNEEGAVLSFNEKGQTGKAWVNAGVYLISRTLIESIPPDRPISIERDLFPAWNGLYGYRSLAQFFDIGTPDAYNNALVYLNKNSKSLG